MGLNQQNIHQGAQQAIQPLEGQQFVPNQGVGVQQGLQNQQVGGQQFVQNQQLQQNQQAGQVLLNQPIAGQNVLQNQPIAGQNVLQNQPIAGHNVLQNQPIAGQNVLQNQPIGGQQILQNQPVIQQVQQNQPVGGQQQVVQNQALGGQPVLQNQQMGGQNVLQNQQQAGQALQGGQQQQILNQQGNINQNVLQNDLRMPAQAQHNLPAGNGGGQLANGIPVVNAGVQNMQGGHQLANQAGQQVVQPVAAGNNPQNIDVKQEQNHDGPLNHEMNPVVKDDALKRMKRDVELSNDQRMDNEQLNVAANNEVSAEGHKIIEIHDKENKDINIVADKDKPVAINNDQSDNAGNKADINKQDENGNIQRDLKQMKPTVPSGDAGGVIRSYDYVDEVIDNMKKNLYSDGDRRNPFVVEMVDKGKSR